MNEDVYLTILFDYYGDLFNEKQKTYFTNYYFLNMSLSEIADELNVSRNAVHKQIKLISEKLVFYENTLHMYNRDKKLEKILSKISDSKEKNCIKKICNLKDN